MNVFIRPYKLTALRGANRLERSGRKSGVHLRVKKRFTDHFADYFPHEALGDAPVELFLETFKYQESEYARKVFHFLLEDERLRSQKQRPYLNHQFWDGRSAEQAPVIKYKLQDAHDFAFLPLLKKGLRLRLDANGLFDRESFLRFQKEIPKDLLPLIDYLEDPMKEKDWSGGMMTLARDFIDGDPYGVLIHKPNVRFLPKTEKKVIFSSYMGSDLGRWHAYCELLELGDLQEYHGLDTPGTYVEEKLDLSRSSTVEDLYKDLHQGEWKLLCSI